MLYVRVIAYYGGLTIILGLSRFLAGAYSLFLYTSCQHGVLPLYFSPSYMFRARNYRVFFFHRVPIFFLGLKIGVIT